MANIFKMFASINSDSEDSVNKNITVNAHRCPQNHTCPSLNVCPVGALTKHDFEAPTIDIEKCIKCGKCIKSCPMKAISFE